MRARMAKKFQAIRFRSGKRLLVAKYDTGGIILKFAGADKSAPRPPLVRTGNGVFLCVGVKRRSGIPRHDIVADPVLQCRSRARVDVILRGIVRKNAALLDGD